MNTWIILRAAGIGAYLMLWLAVAWGLVASTSLVSTRISKQSSNLFHQFAATVALVLLVIHLGGLLVDTFMPFGLPDLLVPLRSSFRPVATAFGVVAMYASVVVLTSSWTRRYIGTPWWRRLHLLAIPTFTLSMLHGIFAGSDAARPWMWGIYVFTGVSVVFLTFVRAFTYGYRPPRAPRPERARPAETTPTAEAAHEAEVDQPASI